MNELAGKHGFGRIDMIENRLIGVKSREIYEVPGALTLITAHKALEDLCLEREVLHYKLGVEQKWAELVYNGMWFSPLKEALDGFVETTQKLVTGDVRLRFFKGSCVIGRPPQPVLALRLQPRDLRRGRHASTTRRPRASSTCTACPPRSGHASAARSARKARSSPHVRHSALLEIRHHRARWSLLLFGAARCSTFWLGYVDGPEAAPEAGRRQPTCASRRARRPTSSEEDSADELTPRHRGAAGSRRRPAAFLPEFGDSLPVDKRMWAEDIRGSIAHARMLAKQGVITEADADAIEAGLSADLPRDQGAASSSGTSPTRTSTWRSSACSPSASAPPGARLHTGRSRNDQVATDTRLYAKRAARRPRRTRVLGAAPGARPARRGAPRRRDARLHAPAEGAAGAASATTCSPTRGCSPATSRGCATPTRPPTCCRSAAPRSRARRTRSTATTSPRGWASRR